RVRKNFSARNDGSGAGLCPPPDPSFFLLTSRGGCGSRRPGQGSDLAKLARQLFPRLAAVGGAVDLATDTAGINQVGIRGVDRQVPQRTIGPAWQARGLPGPAAIGRAADDTGTSRRAIAIAQAYHF